MTHFGWLQSRTQAAVALGGLVLVAVLLVLSGPHLAHLYDTTVTGCAARGDCQNATAAFLRNDSRLRMWLGVLVMVTPAITGIFWGAPLVAGELETGTFRLAWTQSITRSRWLAVKLAVVGLTSIAVAGLLSLMVTWWASPLDRAGMNRYASFDQRAIVPLGYAAFAFVLGVTAGMLIRRVLPAMATTTVAFLTARIVATAWIRPFLLTPLHQQMALDPTSAGYGSSCNGVSCVATLLGGGPRSSLQPSIPNIPNAWFISTRIVDNAGNALTNKVLKADCPLIGTGGPGPSGHDGHSEVPPAVQQALHDCVAKVGTTYHEALTYQPASHYWALQYLELAVFLGAALILTGLCFWWIRRRLT
jgi:hypothetical protein